MDKQFATLTTRHILSIKCPELKTLWHFSKVPIRRTPNLHPVKELNCLKAKLGGDTTAVISSLEITNSNYELAVHSLLDRFESEETFLLLKVHGTFCLFKFYFPTL